MSRFGGVPLSFGPGDAFARRLERVEVGFEERFGGVHIIIPT
jgi:hypothetical protein